MTDEPFVSRPYDVQEADVRSDLFINGPFLTDVFYFEGTSGKLAAGLLPPDPQGYSFFCFEEELPKGCVELMRLGFTATQIREAIDRNNDRIADLAELRYERDLEDWAEGRNR